jgi:hypothetical protein
LPDHAHKRLSLKALQRRREIREMENAVHRRQRPERVRGDPGFHWIRVYAVWKTKYAITSNTTIAGARMARSLRSCWRYA